MKLFSRSQTYSNDEVVTTGIPNPDEITQFVKFCSPYLNGYFSAINKGQENFTMLLVSRLFGPFSVSTSLTCAKRKDKINSSGRARGVMKP